MKEKSPLFLCVQVSLSTILNHTLTKQAIFNHFPSYFQVIFKFNSSVERCNLLKNKNVPPIPILKQHQNLAETPALCVTLWPLRESDTMVSTALGRQAQKTQYFRYFLIKDGPCADPNHARRNKLRQLCNAVGLCCNKASPLRLSDPVAPGKIATCGAVGRCCNEQGVSPEYWRGSGSSHSSFDYFFLTKCIST